MGDRIQPSGDDPLPWEELSNYQGVFISAGDMVALKYCRMAKVLTATPRLGANTINNSKIESCFKDEQKSEPRIHVGN